MKDDVMSETVATDTGMTGTTRTGTTMTGTAVSGTAMGGTPVTGHAAMKTVHEDRTAMLPSLDADLVADAIRAAGCGVTPVPQDGVVHLHSACHGVGFQVLWGNPMPAVEAGASPRWADLTLSCPLRVQGGSLPAALESEWHRAKRFARVSRHGDHVVLEMDIIAAGGISRGHLEVQLGLWMQMMGQFFGFLRNYRADGEATAAAGAAA